MDTIGFTQFFECLERSPVIAGLINEEQVEECKKSSCEIAYILFGDICNISEIVDKVIEAGKIPIVHIDLINGLSSREICVDFIHKCTRAVGIISTKSHLIKRGNELGMITIQRFFMIDRMNYNNIKKQIRDTSPNIVEVMPAGLTKMIEYVMEEINGRPLVASGLIIDRSYVLKALSAGAVAVSTTNTDIWEAL